MIRVLYSFAIFVYKLALTLASPFNTKAKRSIQIRRQQDLSILKNYSKAYWFHCSSLGELEQAYPLMKECKHAGKAVVVSLFSTSGFDYWQKYELIDHAFLLPFDTKSNAQKLMQEFNPSKVYWVKNDFFFNFFAAITIEKIPLYLFSVKLYQGHFLFNPMFKSFLSFLKKITFIYCIDNQSYTLLKDQGFTNVKLSGDTRVHRVKNRVLAVQKLDWILQWKKEDFLIIYASIHPEDFAVLSFLNEENIKHLIVPHEIHGPQNEQIQQRISIDFEEYSKDKTLTKNVVLLNKVGILFDCYQYADLVYVGGGFSKGIHNILEPTVFGTSVIFGPNHTKFWEATHFLALNLAKEVTNKAEFLDLVMLQHQSPHLALKAKMEYEAFYSAYPNFAKQIFDHTHKHNV